MCRVPQFQHPETDTYNPFDPAMPPKAVPAEAVQEKKPDDRIHGAFVNVSIPSARIVIVRKAKCLRTASRRRATDRQ